MTDKSKQSVVTFGDQWITIDDINCIANLKIPVALSENRQFQEKVRKSEMFLEKLLREEGAVYGVTTGFGDSCVNTVPLELAPELPMHLVRFHGCGLGAYFTDQQARAIMAVRLCSLTQGVSGVSIALLQQLVTFLNKDILPVIPEEGSVGASGDLTPLSYLAAAVMGERDVRYQGKTMPAEKVLKELNIKPITLKPKEGLAIMNGTAVMTAIACEAYQRTDYLCRLGARLTAMASIALKGNAFHFSKRLFAFKPHKGQQIVASWIEEDLTPSNSLPRNSYRLQDRYSLRCAPHVIGVAQDSLPWFKTMIENEINSVNDNPVIDGEEERVLHGGHFYGGHIATVMDTMKTQVANLADLLDRQMALLMDTKFNNGLPPNLSASDKKRASINHGFKAVQIGVSAWTAEALKNTMPASVFSRSTECHNQDKVSMGTIAARDCLRVLELTEQVFAAHLLACTQAISIRLNTSDFQKNDISKSITDMMNSVLREFDIVTEDRPLDLSLRQFVKNIRQRKWALY